MNLLSDVKKILGIGDTLQDPVLNLIIATMTAQLRRRLWGTPAEVPEVLSYILLEATVARYNRLGSESVTAQTEEGHSLSWGDQDYFKPFAHDIALWNEEHGPNGDRMGEVILI